MDWALGRLIVFKSMGILMVVRGLCRPISSTRSLGREKGKGVNMVYDRVILIEVSRPWSCTRVQLRAPYVSVLLYVLPMGLLYQSLSLLFVIV